MNKYKTYKNKKFLKRSYDRTDVVCIRTNMQLKNATRFPEIWIPCDEKELKNLTKLHIVARVEYYGYL